MSDLKKYSLSWDITDLNFRKETPRFSYLLPLLELFLELRRRGYEDSIMASKMIDCLILKHPPHPKLHVRLMAGAVDPQKLPAIFILADSSAPTMRVIARLNGQTHDTIMSSIAVNDELIAMLDALSTHSYDYLFEHLTVHENE